MGRLTDDISGCSLETVSYHRKTFPPVLGIVADWPDAIDKLSEEGQAKTLPNQAKAFSR